MTEWDGVPPHRRQRPPRRQRQQPTSKGLFWTCWVLVTAYGTLNVGTTTSSLYIHMTPDIAIATTTNPHRFWDDTSTSTTTRRTSRRTTHTSSSRTRSSSFGSGSTSSYRRYNTDDDTVVIYATLSDIWLCLACALGWTLWLLNLFHDSVSQHGKGVIFEQEASRKVMGHVLQVALGEDADGTGIPVYHALVDYVVQPPEDYYYGLYSRSNSCLVPTVIDHDGGHDDDNNNNKEELSCSEPLQVRKCFSTRKLLEEGFANVEVLVLTDDPTTSILLDDFLDDQRERAKKLPPSIWWYVGIYTVAAMLIGTSLIGGLYAVWSLDETDKAMGWTSLILGSIFLYPVAVLLYKVVSWCYRTAGPLADRHRGVIMHGANRFGRALNKTRCGGGGNTQTNATTAILGLDMFDGLQQPSMVHANNTMNTKTSALELSSRQFSDMAQKQQQQQHHINTTTQGGSYSQNPNTNHGKTKVPLSPLYPNAGCGFGNFNIHMPAQGQSTTNSSISSMSSGSGMSCHHSTSTTGHASAASKSSRHHHHHHSQDDDYKRTNTTAKSHFQSHIIGSSTSHSREEDHVVENTRTSHGGGVRTATTTTTTTTRVDSGSIHLSTADASMLEHYQAIEEEPKV